eukprot:415069-Pelagomonas_calceolata.AAC.2
MLGTSQPPPIAVLRMCIFFPRSKPDAEAPDLFAELKSCLAWRGSGTYHLGHHLLWGLGVLHKFLDLCKCVRVCFLSALRGSAAGLGVMENK